MITALLIVLTVLLVATALLAPELAPDALRLRALIFPAREVAEPAARRMPPRLENGAAAGRPPGDGGNPGAAHSRTDAVAPGTARIDVYNRFRAAMLAEDRDPGPWLAGQRRAPRHAPTMPRIDLSRPADPVRTDDAPPWEIPTGTQRALGLADLGPASPRPLRERIRAS